MYMYMYMYIYMHVMWIMHTHLCIHVCTEIPGVSYIAMTICSVLCIIFVIVGVWYSYSLSSVIELLNSGLSMTGILCTV